MPIRLIPAASAAGQHCAAGAAIGQAGAGGPAPVGAAQAPAPAATAASAPAAPGRLGYRSAFDGYRSFSDQPVVSWREANDLVGRIGGWQAYAREAQGLAAEKPSPAARAASDAGAHSGHKTP